MIGQLIRLIFLTKDVRTLIGKLEKCGDLREEALRNFWMSILIKSLFFWALWVIALSCASVFTTVSISAYLILLILVIYIAFTVLLQSRFDLCQQVLCYSSGELIQGRYKGFSNLIAPHAVIDYDLMGKVYTFHPTQLAGWTGGRPRPIRGGQVPVMILHRPNGGHIPRIFIRPLFNQFCLDRAQHKIVLVNPIIEEFYK